ncbi:MAG: hypothetical protein P8J27_12065 [Mariniblastus sp.]|nr:hypothetical protein [Mariniblastus sp.]
MLLVIDSASAQSSVDDARQSLSKKSLPWYDSDADSIRPMEMGQRPDARSANRDAIPVRSAASPANQKGSRWNSSGQDYGSLMLSFLNALTWIAIVAVVLIFVAVLIWAILRMGSATQSEDDSAALKRSMEESIKQLPFELGSSTGDFRGLAETAYSQGDFAKAITYLFSHVLISLDQKGLIRLKKGKTNRQYLRELHGYRSLADYYRDVMVPFESVFFGDHDLKQSEFETCWSQLDSFQMGVQQTRQVTHV